MTMAKLQFGRITLAGAGPGDPDLLTVKALRALQTADLILHDALVSPAILALARPAAERVFVGKKGHGPAMRQEEINALMLAAARAGRDVLRLKGGDPLIFGRAGEEIAAARAAGIAVEIIPGVTSAQAAGAAIGASLTHRDHARRLQFVTGHDRTGALPQDFDWRALADPVATTVVYMAKSSFAPLAAMLCGKGLDGDTPAVAVMDASLPSQRILRSTLADLPAQLAAETWPGPVLVLIGRALDA